MYQTSCRELYTIFVEYVDASISMGVNPSANCFETYDGSGQQHKATRQHRGRGQGTCLSTYPLTSDNVGWIQVLDDLQQQFERQSSRYHNNSNSWIALDLTALSYAGQFSLHSG